MGTYQIPRNTKGEGRLFYIFSTKALIYTISGVIIGVIIRAFLTFLGSLFGISTGIFSTIGIILIVLLAVIGFVIGTFSVPKNDRFEITRKAGGIKLDKFILNSIKFKIKKNKLYVFDTKEIVREEIKADLEEEEEVEENKLKLRAKNKENELKKQRGGYIR